MISVTILVKNGENSLKETLNSLKDFSEVVVLDTGSTDRTKEIALSFKNVSWYESPFKGFGPSHNEASSLAKNDWILSIDADETLSRALAQEILSFPLNSNTIYSLPFKNFFCGKEIKHCGWAKERHIRLYNRTKTRFSDAMVHEGVIANGLETLPLKNPVFHTSYTSISDFLIKMERYTTLFSDQNRGKKSSSPFTAFTHSIAAFFRTFFLKLGFLDGYEGYLISCYNAQTAHYKYLKLYHANSAMPNAPSSRNRKTRKFPSDT